MTSTNKKRKEFREQCRKRDNHECIIPWCTEDAEDVHHIIERELWDDGSGGYIKKNGVSICNHHHKYAEMEYIPPQAFWFWLGIEDPLLPESIDTWQVNKWGDKLQTPSWEDLRKYIKYPSTRHLLPLYWYDDETTAESRIEHDDTGLESVDDFVGVPLVILEKMDGGNCMMVNDDEYPVRARNGSRPRDTMELLYSDLYWRQEGNRKIPERLQIFGEWMFAKHSIHYGCECEPKCDDVGPYLSELVEYDDNQAYFQIFGAYDTEKNLWLSWNEVEMIADELGFPTVPVLYCEDDADTATFETEAEARNTLIEYARNVIDAGGEGIIVRSKFPFHYGEFERRIGKYVRENHVDDDAEHWSKRTVKENNV